MHKQTWIDSFSWNDFDFLAVLFVVDFYADIILLREKLPSDPAEKEPELNDYNMTW